MKRIKQLLVPLLVVAMMVSCIIPVAAAEGKSPVTLTAAERATVGTEVEVQALATEAELVADGVLVISYNAEKLTYLDTQAGPAWSNPANIALSVNSGEAGKVTIAFSSSSYAMADSLFTLRFEAKGAGEAAFAIVDGYVTGAAKPSGVAATRIFRGVCDGGEDCPTADYRDLHHTGEAHDAIDYMVESGLMIGVAENTFAPTMAMNRAMIATILYRLEGNPEHGGNCPFIDVQQDQWFYDAVVWAYEAGVTNGTSSVTFGPATDISREQLVTFLYRYATLDGDVTVDRDVLNGYTDAEQISPWAVDAFAWAIENGIIKGTTETTLSPLNTATREQIALVIYRFVGGND